MHPVEHDHYDELKLHEPLKSCTLTQASTAHLYFYAVVFFSMHCFTTGIHRKTIIVPEAM